VAEELGLPEVTVCAAELDFESLLELQNRSLQVKPIPRFPAVTRDISLIVEEKIRWADITDAIKKKASAELEEVQFGGIYRGRPIADGKKSVTVSLRFRDEDGTLRHEVVDGFENEILSELMSSIGAELRTV
jgi:phenylalanyl-tRNA synthetase beta chain